MPIAVKVLVSFIVCLAVAILVGVTPLGWFCVWVGGMLLCCIALHIQR